MSPSSSWSATAQYAYPKQYFVMVIGQYIDSFSPEQSDAANLKRNGVRRYLVLRDDSIKAMSGLAFFRNLFGDAHLWRERYITNVLFCLSDQLKSEIDHLGLRVPKHYTMKEN
ncbi:hypothetical protein [Rhodoblastus acidophilus]|uniref:hypothetical protein n=1 Tax=Rhodoblastus acidophilus TaxID=1074 RepID=UPI001AECF782|nr:hypothetical protein [Rhodoblastus acidophilus]